jgi:hypothetical protein
VLRLLATSIAVLLLPAPALARSVIIFPLDARGVAYDTAQTATHWVLETMRAIPDTRVIDPKTVEAELGVKLTEQARACEYDLFCLVEVGEILEGDAMLIGHVRRVGGNEDEVHELKLIVLDVPKATITDVVIWKVPTARQGGLENAVRAASRRLFSRPDAMVTFVLEPPNARVSFFGDQVQIPEDGTLPYWSGTYLAEVEAEGYHPKELRVVIPPSTKEKNTRIPIELEPDPLYVPKGGVRKVQPFDRASRREGSGVTAEVAGAVPEDDGPQPILFSPWPWLGAAAGIGVGIAGGVLMGMAQSDYNELSMQERYKPGVTVTAQVAIQRRDEARDRFQTGSGLLIAGGAVLVGTAIWVIIDWVLTPREP